MFTLMEVFLAFSLAETSYYYERGFVSLIQPCVQLLFLFHLMGVDMNIDYIR